MSDERPQLTKSQAINNQWTIAYHRLTYTKEHNRPFAARIAGSIWPQ
jgi:hypothetical protein